MLVVFFLPGVCVVCRSFEASWADVALFPTVTAAVVGWPWAIREEMIFLAASVAKFAWLSFVLIICGVFRATVVRAVSV